MSPSNRTATQTRKDVAIEFLRLAATGRVEEAFGPHTTPDFRHHNPHFRGDAKSLASAMAENAAANPQKTLTVIHALEDGNLVAVFSRVRHRDNGPLAAVAHVFRFEDQRIAELWDVGQEEPADSPNENGMF